MNTLSEWLRQHPLSRIEVDCATTVMLKIMDGKCKMIPEEKRVMTLLYDAVKHLPGELFTGENIHAFIDSVRASSNEDIRMEIYEKRLMAETMLSRPLMKQFKARIRRQGLFSLECVQVGAV